MWAYLDELLWTKTWFVEKHKPDRRGKDDAQVSPGEVLSNGSINFYTTIFTCKNGLFVSKKRVSFLYKIKAQNFWEIFLRENRWVWFEVFFAFFCVASVFLRHLSLPCVCFVFFLLCFACLTLFNANRAAC
jgi:hypothetical protein